MEGEKEDNQVPHETPWKWGAERKGKIKSPMRHHGSREQVRHTE